MSDKPTRPPQDPTPTIREGSVILLVNAQGELAFQLRDDRPEVPYPNQWGLFGGWQKPDESPEQAITREMKEELGLQLDAKQLRYLHGYRDGNVVAHVFYYPAPESLRQATVLEGQRLEFLRLEELEQRAIVPRHKRILEWYERHKSA